MTLTLAAGAWRAALRPALGGSFSGVWYNGKPVFRAAPDGSNDPLDMACFPLVPYANRIANGRFAFEGEAHQLPLNFGDHPHSLHGLGWQRAWEVDEADSASALLVHTHDGGAGWPWRYRAEQRVTLGEGGLTVALNLRNDDIRAMPAGLGLHPYFPRDAATRLRARAEMAWLAGPTLLPETAAPADHFGDWATGDGLSKPALVDHAHDGWDGEAVIAQPDGEIRIAAAGARAFHLYIPPGEDYFCIEPVTHLPDALNRPDFVMDVLPPGGTLRLVMTISDCDAASSLTSRDI